MLVSAPPADAGIFDSIVRAIMYASSKSADDLGRLGKGGAERAGKLGKQSDELGTGGHGEAQGVDDLERRLNEPGSHEASQGRGGVVTPLEESGSRGAAEPVGGGKFQPETVESFADTTPELAGGKQAKKLKQQKMWKSVLDDDVVGFIPENYLDELMGKIDRYLDSQSKNQSPSISDVGKLFECGRDGIIECLLNATESRIQQIDSPKERSIRFVDILRDRVDYGAPVSEKAIERVTELVDDPNFEKLKVLQSLVIASAVSEPSESLETYLIGFEAEAAKTISSRNGLGIGRARICAMTTTPEGKVRDELKKIDQEYCSNDDLTLNALLGGPFLRVYVAMVFAIRGEKKGFEALVKTLKVNEVFPDAKNLTKIGTRDEIRKAYVLGLLGYSFVKLGRIAKGLTYMWRAHGTLSKFPGNKFTTSFKGFFAAGFAISGYAETAQKVIWEIAEQAMFSMDSSIRAKAASTLVGAIYDFGAHHKNL